MTYLWRVKGHPELGSVWVHGNLVATDIDADPYVPAVAELCPPGYCYGYSAMKMGGLAVWVNDYAAGDVRESFAASDYPVDTTLAIARV